MAKLKINAIADNKPVKLTVELSATVFQDLASYAEAITRTSDAPVPIEPSKLVGPMLERFMTSDRAFRKMRRGFTSQSPASGAVAGGAKSG